MLTLTLVSGQKRNSVRYPLPAPIIALLGALATVALLLCAGCAGRAGSESLPQSLQPKYGSSATPVSSDHTYFQQPGHPAPDYWALSPFYLPQRNEYDCSAAAVAAVVNALTRANRPLKETDRNASVASLLEAVTTARWAERVQKQGVDGQVGLSLEQLADVLKEALRLQGITAPRIETVRVTADDPATRAAWRKALAANEASADDIILIHFTQDTLTGAGGGPYPHISPIGAFDAVTDRALVMDVDREYYEPYWSPADMIAKAMAASTPQYGHGGWIRVRR